MRARAKNGRFQEAAWNPSPRVRAFLAAYRATASVTRAALAALIRREAHYRLLERSADYRAAFEAAGVQATQTLEDEAIRRAVEGVMRPVLYHGKAVLVPADPAKPRGKKRALTEHEYSDTLLLALLKARKPQEYRERVDHAVEAKTTLRFDGTLTDLLAHYHQLASAARQENGA